MRTVPKWIAKPQAVQPTACEAPEPQKLELQEPRLRQNGGCCCGCFPSLLLSFAFWSRLLALLMRRRPPLFPPPSIGRVTAFLSVYRCLDRLGNKLQEPRLESVFTDDGRTQMFVRVLRDIAGLRPPGRRRRTDSLCGESWQLAVSHVDALDPLYARRVAQSADQRKEGVSSVAMRHAFLSWRSVKCG